MLKKLFLASILLSSILLVVTTAGPTQDYEFLVRVKDKVRDNVICFSPIHGGEGYGFEDKTHKAKCPECNSDCLYRDHDAATKKGDIITFKPAGWGWGENERKHYAIIRINCTYEQAKGWCESGKIRPRKYKIDLDSIFSQEQLEDWINEDREVNVITAPAVIKDKINAKTEVLDTSYVPVSVEP